MAETRVVITGDANQAVSEFQRLLAVATGSLQNISALGGSTARVMAGIAGTVAAASAAYLSFAGIINGVSQSIDRLAQLDDSAQKTGSSVVDSLSKLQKVAMMTNVEFGNVDKAVFNLAKTLGAAGDESNAARKALSDLGISAKDIQGEDTAATFIRIAKSLQNYEDGAGKSAVMNTLFKKSAEELMPYMNDVAESVDKFSGRTQQAATQASGFQDAMGLMKVRTAEMYDVLTDSLLPALAAFTGRLLDSDGAISRLSGRVDALGKSGELRKWAEDIADSVGYIVNAIGPAVKVAAAYFALFVAAPAIYTAVAAVVSTLVGVIATYAMNVLIGQTATIGLNTALFGTSVQAELASGALTKMQLAGNALFAAFAGWQIGTYLRDNFVEARLAGLTFVGVMLKGWENLKYGGTMAVEAISFAWDSAIGTMKAAHAGFVSAVAKGLSLIGQDDRAAEMDAYADSLRAAGGAVGTFTARTAALNAAHQAEIDTIDRNIVEMMAYEMSSNAVAAADGTVEENKKKLLKATKDNTEAIKAEREAYAGIISGIKSKIAEGRLELALDANATESQKARIKLDQELASGKLKLSSAHQATVRGVLDEQAAVELLLKTRATEKEVAKYIDQSTTARSASTAQLAAEYQAYGQSSDARELAMVEVKEQAALEQFLSQQKIAGRAISDEQIIQLKGEAMARVAVEQATLAQSKALAYAGSLKTENAKFAAESLADPKARADALLAIDVDMWQERIAIAGAGTEAQRSLQGEYNTWYRNQSKKLLVDVDLTRATEMLKIMEAVDDAARQAAAGMEASFGRIGSAIGSLTTALTGYQRAQATVAAQLAAAILDAKGDPTKIAQAQALAAQQGAQAQIKSYGDMAGAARGFFKENSKGYKALETTEKAFRAVEMAMAIENTVRKSGLLEAFTGLFVASKATETTVDTAATGTSVVNSGIRAAADGVAAFAKTLASIPFPFNVAAGAAVVALLAGMGVKIAGGGGGGGMTSAQRQETQGTGSVFGDKSAKSDSIARSIELAATNSSIELTHTAGMLASLKAIENSIGGLGNLLVRGSGLTGEMPAGSKSAAENLVNNDKFQLVFGGVIGLAFSKLDQALGGWAGKIASSVFGGKVTTLDTGLTANAASLGSIAAGGLNAQQYTDIKKSGGLFHSDKYDSPKTELGAEANDQFSKVILSLATGVKTAAELLGVGGDEFTRHLNSFVVDIGKISLKDLKGEEIQSALESVFAKLGDDMAQFGVAGLEQFQQVGEGYFETLTRVATNYANLNSIMESIGTSFGATGTSSIAARERLIELTGGIDGLASQTSAFANNFLTEAERLAPVQKYVTDQLAAMGLQSLDTRDKFKEYALGLVNSGALATEAGAQRYASVLALSEAYAKTHVATVDLTKSEQAIADERVDLRNQLDELTMTQAQLAAKARAAIDGHNLALYDQVVVAQAAKDSAAALASVNEGYQQQIDALLKASMTVVEVRAIETRGMDATTLALYDRLEALKAEAKAVVDAKAATEALTKAQRDAAAALGKALLTAVESAFSGLTAAVGEQKKLLESAHKTVMDSIQAQIDRTSGLVTKLTSLSDALHGTLDSIRGQSGSAVDDRVSAQAQVAAALAVARASGVMPDADSLKGALSTLSKDASDQFSSYLDYQRDLYSTQNNLAALADLTDDQLGTEERALIMLEKQKDLAQLAYDAEVLRLDGLIDTAKAQLDVLNGINIGVASIPAMLAAFANAIKAAMANPVANVGATTADAYSQFLGRAASTSEVDYWKGQAGNGVDVVGAIKGSDEAKIQALYKSLLGRTGDAAGVDAWEAALAAGQSWDAIKAGFIASDEYKKLHPPGFAAGGDFMGGLRIVGENGPELEATGPSRIFNASQTRSMLNGGDNSEVVAELRLLRAEVKEMRNRELYAIAKNTLNTADSLDGAINGETPIATKEVETA
ncbi:DUF4214 domain-containing protein [Duganella aceris]|uniref:DUF4214 domain-containing protein n=1 Tax=Duganella aceris TaxID=2703883 RepID=A0ABX0FPJ5_9BURK|nr:DUF4214 domain-containing protein [Duganella aceris]NGZ86407.1 DUF4214 domain-containing protein [Duganella aceris]